MSQHKTTEPTPLVDELAAALRIVLWDYSQHDYGTIDARCCVREALARYDAEWAKPSAASQATNCSSSSEASV